MTQPLFDERTRHSGYIGVRLDIRAVSAEDLERFVRRQHRNAFENLGGWSLEFDAENLLKVMADNACQLNSRWYSGSGIYRHVWLIVADRVHIGHWGVYVTTPEVAPEMAVVRVRTTVENESEMACEATLRSRIVAPNGASVGGAESQATINAGGRSEYSQDVRVASPQLWSPDAPYLYRLETEVSVGDGIVDTATTVFGIRSLHFDTETGFLLNGQPLKRNSFGNDYFPPKG